MVRKTHPTWAGIARPTLLEPAQAEACGYQFNKEHGQDAGAAKAKM